MTAVLYPRHRFIKDDPLDLSPYILHPFSINTALARRKQLRLANLTAVDGYVRRKAGA